MPERPQRHGRVGNTRTQWSRGQHQLLSGARRWLGERHVSMCVSGPDDPDQQPAVWLDGVSAELGRRRDVHELEDPLPAHH